MGNVAILEYFLTSVCLMLHEVWANEGVDALFDRCCRGKHAESCPLLHKRNVRNTEADYVEQYLSSDIVREAVLAGNAADCELYGKGLSAFARRVRTMEGARRIRLLPAAAEEPWS